MAGTPHRFLPRRAAPWRNAQPPGLACVPVRAEASGAPRRRVAARLGMRAVHTPPHAQAAYVQGIRAENTREKYTRTLRNIVCEIMGDILKESVSNGDAKIDGLERTIERMTKGEGAGHDTPAGTKKGADDEEGDADDLDMRGPGPYHRDSF